MSKALTEILLIISILLSPSFIQAADQPPKIPETLDEILAIGKKALDIFLQAFKGVWQEAVEIWQKIIDFFKDLWNIYIFPKVEKTWQRFLSLFKKEIKEKKEIIPKELEKEKKEIKEESKSFFQTFKEWLKK